MAVRSMLWIPVAVALSSLAGCASNGEHPLHILAESEHNIVVPVAVGGGSGQWSPWPSHNLAEDPFHYDFGYQLKRYVGNGSPANYSLARRVYTPQIYGYPNKGVGIRPYRHMPNTAISANLPQRYTHYPGIPGYRSHRNQSVYGYRSYGYGRSARGTIGGVPRSGFGYRR